ncbi:hypothetical protein ATANTOWER_029559 [Ataeniobius toweri]|uniref:Zinc finger PHD-type domain-containing protein n=1 Tax=Ataeniobius toweri TaxID=208326 RepID=A0ABU7CD77_9TELE|nr:hypothetical protein [Ataeniobius toweri]
MEMAKMTVMEFPNIPKNFHVESSKRCIKTLRQDMAEEILKGSDSRYMFCSFCGNGDLLHPVIAALWIQCETCERWFHTECIEMTPAQTAKTPLGTVCCLITRESLVSKLE